MPATNALRVVIDTATAASARALRSWCSTVAAVDLAAGAPSELEAVERAFVLVDALHRHLGAVLKAAHVEPASRLYHQYTFDVLDHSGAVVAAVAISLLGDDKAEFARPIAASRAIERHPQHRLSHEPPRITPIHD